jgi:hypothetical protein
VLLSPHPEAGPPSGAPGSQQPPALETGPVSSLTGTSATLGGTVNPDRATVSSCRFEYGLSTAYGSSVACGSLPGSGSSPVAVSASVSGLLAATSYHFRIVATNAGGTALGPDLAFTTGVAGHSASAATASSMLLAAVDPQALAGGAW